MISCVLRRRRLGLNMLRHVNTHKAFLVCVLLNRVLKSDGRKGKLHTTEYHRLGESFVHDFTINTSFVV